ncbi:MAG: prepilin-type N-terminal cleavage/methylation domain-containing protein [Alphaproteobacteria bacterium]|nr:prepilin-type N-terminal cleavage/methylation domain-containing protein [Alphaproteobacteria bacterium]
MNRPARADRQGGFTLLEMTVSLALLGFLVVGLTQGVRSGTALWGAQSRHLDETANLDAAARLLRELLTGIPAAATSGVGAGAGAAAAIGLKGEESQLAFVGDLPTGVGNMQRADITVLLRSDQLLLRWVPHRHEQSSAPPPVPTETELLQGVEQLQFAYWGQSALDAPAGWSGQWDGPAFPELVRVRLAFAKGDPRRWPDLIAAPQLGPAN